MAEPQKEVIADEPIARERTGLKVRIEHLWLAVPVALVVCFGFIKKLPLVDFWWHLKAGEIILNTASIPRTDLFSFTAAGNEYILQNWLVEVIYYLLYRAGGLPMLVFFNTLLLVAALLPVYHLCRTATTRLRLSAVAAMVAGMSLVYFGSARSQVFSFLLFSVFYWSLTRYINRERSFIFALPFLMMGWVNFHGAFVLGLGLILLFFGSEAARRLIYGQRPETLTGRELGRLAVSLLLCGLATLANPEGYRVYKYVRAVAQNPASQSFVLEWQPPLINDLAGIILFYGPFFITLLVLLYANSRPGLTHIALFLTFSIFGLMAIRNAVWFGLVAAPILARYFPSGDDLRSLRPLRRFSLVDRLALWVERRRESQAPVRYRLNRQIAAMMLVITFALTPWVYPHLGNRMLGSALWEKETPVGAVDFIKEKELQGNIFHPQLYGDYLVWRAWPAQRSFIDGRVHLFGDKVVQDYRLVFYDSHWEERLAPYEIRYLLISKAEQEHHMVIDSARSAPGWRLLYEDELSVLFEKLQ
ncbi:MAG TPA: hypothetical protein VFQ92_07520 [Blastocatellia bacterium]|nr:hypothetical protein [Blastocatellia bacterium]